MKKTQRLLSLDVFRGLTIAGMILVNNAGSFPETYAPLRHAAWHGSTPTDWVFPFFLFIMGVAIPLAIGKRLSRGDTEGQILGKIGVRALIIFGLGLLLTAMPHFGMEKRTGWLPTLHYLLLAVFFIAIFTRALIAGKKPGEATALDRQNRRKRIAGIAALTAAAGMAIIGWQAYDLSSLRIPGVLQRIAVVYALCALLFIKVDWKGVAWITAGILILYWILLTVVPVPGGIAPNLEPETNLGAWLDRLLLGDHLWSYSETWDPEGILSTLPAVATGLSGVLTGLWIKTDRSDYQKITGMFAFGTLALAVGLIWNEAFPINKSLWTSSYVAYTSGLALLGFATTYWLIDRLGYRVWSQPFRVFGTNALFSYILSILVTKVLIAIKVPGADGEQQSAFSWLYYEVFAPYLSGYNASLGFALANVLFCLAVVWLLYQRRIYIKV